MDYINIRELDNEKVWEFSIILSRRGSSSQRAAVKEIFHSFLLKTCKFFKSEWLESMKAGRANDSIEICFTQSNFEKDHHQDVGFKNFFHLSLIAAMNKNGWNLKEFSVKEPREWIFQRIQVPQAV